MDNANKLDTSINADAATVALETGFVVLNFKAHELQIQQARYCYTR